MNTPYTLKKMVVGALLSGGLGLGGFVAAGTAMIRDQWWNAP